MVILALETVTRRGSVALMVDGVAHARSGPEGPTHGERLPAELFDWLAAHGRELDDVDRFAVVCGPGSFTGMRVGIAAMQGLALATGRPVAGIPTLDALLRAWWDTTPTHDGIVVPVLDGQRSDVFVDIVDAGGAPSADQVVRLADPRVTTAGELAALLEPWKTRRITIVGDGAPKCTEILARTLPHLSIGTTAMPLAEAAARIVQAHPELAGAPHALRPVYLRRPDAVLARERAEARSAAAACTIRRAVISEDLASVEGLQRQTFTNPWGAEAIRWELENTDVARLYVMHAPDGALVAYCACWIVFDELHINSLAVDVSRRRQGLARELLAFVLADAIRAGATSATLEVRASNIAARRLYEKLGFKVEGIRRDYYQDPREDAVILWARGLTGESTKYEVRSTK